MPPLLISESVSGTPYSMEITGVPFIRLKIFSKIEDKIVDGTRIGIYLIAPYQLKYFFSGHHLTLILNQ